MSSWIADLLRMNMAAFDDEIDADKISNIENAIVILERNPVRDGLSTVVARKYIGFWLSLRKDFSRQTLEITDIYANRDEQAVLIITIRLVRPSLLVGKDGKTIDSLIEFLKSRIGGGYSDVKIKLVEEKMWK